MTPSVYMRALRQLERGTLRDGKVGDLATAAATRLAAVGYPAKVASDCATAITAFWHQEIERREWDREAVRIADAAARFRSVVEGAKLSREYLRMPDATLWRIARARPVGNDVMTIGLARYLRAIEAYLREAPPASGHLWEQHGNLTGRKANLAQFVIRYVAHRTPAVSGRDGGTPTQHRYGRNAFIATVCTALLARSITRQKVAQTLKKTV